MSVQLISFPACNLIYLGSMDVISPGSDRLLAESVQLMKSLDPPSVNIVTFKASKEGITLTESNTVG